MIWSDERLAGSERRGITSAPSWRWRPQRAKKQEFVVKSTSPRGKRNSPNSSGRQIKCGQKKGAGGLSGLEVEGRVSDWGGTTCRNHARITSVIVLPQTASCLMSALSELCHRRMLSRYCVVGGCCFSFSRSWLRPDFAVSTDDGSTSM